MKSFIFKKNISLQFNKIYFEKTWYLINQYRNFVLT